MNIAVTGGSGFVGSALTGYLSHLGCHVYILTRNSSNKQNNDQVTYVEWLHSKTRPEQELPSLDAVVNLAGASLNKRWTDKQKRVILESRIQATREINRIIGEMNERPEVLVNASAVGFYGTSKTEEFTEKSAPQAFDFLQKVCVQWESEASYAAEYGVRTVFARFGLILDDKEGALPKMMLPYKMFGGGPIGSGSQWYSWVHLRDVIQLLVFAIENKAVKGPMNVTAPNPEQMNDFGKKLARILHRPHWIPVPAFLVRRALGEMSILLLEGQKVIPAVPMAHGYRFSYPELEEALQDIIHSS